MGKRKATWGKPCAGRDYLTCRQEVKSSRTREPARAQEAGRPISPRSPSDSARPKEWNGVRRLPRSHWAGWNAIGRRYEKETNAKRKRATEGSLPLRASNRSRDCEPPLRRRSRLDGSCRAPRDGMEVEPREQSRPPRAVGSSPSWARTDLRQRQAWPGTESVVNPEAVHSWPVTFDANGKIRRPPKESKHRRRSGDRSEAGRSQATKADYSRARRSGSRAHRPGAWPHGCR